MRGWRMEDGEWRKGVRIVLHPLSSILVFFITGCASPERIAKYPPMPPDQALKLLADRAHPVHAVTAQGTITLTRANGDTVRLDAAIVLDPPDRARLRAWKFGQAVFDMTLTPEGLWLVAPDDPDRRREITAAGANTARLTREWLRLMTGAFDAPNLTARDDGPRLLVTQSNPDGTTMTCTVAKDTLTPRRFTLTDPEGTQRFSLTLDRYADYAAIVWPRRIDAVSDTGRIRIDLREVEINGDLPETAFRPPRRAEQIAEGQP
jgi:hypothetical protein